MAQEKSCKSHTQKRERSPAKLLKEQNNIKQELSEEWPKKKKKKGGGGGGGINEMDPSSEQALGEKAK